MHGRTAVIVVHRQSIAHNLAGLVATHVHTRGWGSAAHLKIEEVERTVQLPRRESEEQEESSEPFSTEPFISTETDEKISELNPGNQLQEVTP